jgi:DNA-binding winged helix-turn-helix (wHTH) protein/tetratricopeptide (TPR) repeat protein
MDMSPGAVPKEKPVRLLGLFAPRLLPVNLVRILSFPPKHIRRRASLNWTYFYGRLIAAVLYSPQRQVGQSVNEVAPSRGVVRFDAFEVDLRSGEVRKHGFRIRLQDQPFHVLQALLDHPGELVTRDELQRQIWPADTFVDFEKGLNNAVKRLRDALGDSVGKPRFIETHSKRGYRFIGSLTPTNETGRTEEGAAGTVASFGKHWKVMVPAAAAVIAVASSGNLYFHRTPKLADKDTIVLADFANHTGDPVFDDALRQALSVQLEQSPLFSIVSDRKVSETLKLMSRSPTDRVTPEVAKEICVRTGGKAVLAGSISSLGSEYVVGLEAVACNTGDVLAKEQAEATSKEGTLRVLSQVTDRLRAKIGESLASVQKFKAPAEVTTSSLEALKAHGMAHTINNSKGTAEALPLEKHAIELDPNFATAYLALGLDYLSLGQGSLANENFTKAYELRERASEREKYRIVEIYHHYVTGDWQKAVQVDELWIHTYPADPVPHADLAIIHLTFGHFEQALSEFQDGLRLDPDDANSYGNLTTTYIYLNRLDDAKKMLEQAQARKLDNEFLHERSYALAFLNGDQAEMNRELAWGTGKPGAEDALLLMQYSTEAYYGHLQKAREFSRRAVESAIRTNGKEAAAFWEINRALDEAELGNDGAAKHAVKSALELDSGKDVKLVAALTLARVGDTTRAKRLVAELEKQYPLDVKLRMILLPTVEAAIQLNSGDAAQALATLEATLPYEFVTVLYPAYLRGQTQLSAHNSTAAVAEFQKLLDHPGVVLNDCIGALAHLQIGRAYAMQGDTAKAKVAYQDFLLLWKDADPDIPFLKQARAEYAKLQ